MSYRLMAPGKYRSISVFAMAEGERVIVSDGTSQTVENINDCGNGLAQRRAVPADDRDAAYYEALLYDLFCTAYKKQAAGDEAGARQAFSECAALGRDRHRFARDLTPAFLDCLGNVATAKLGSGDLVGAKRDYQEILQIREQWSAGEPCPRSYRAETATDLLNLGEAEQRLGEREAARREFAASFEIRRWMNCEGVRELAAESLEKLSEVSDQAPARASLEKAFEFLEDLRSTQSFYRETDQLLTLVKERLTGLRQINRPTL